MPNEKAAPSAGPSLAAAALRRGVTALARSFRMHRPRGAFCHAGWCQQCRVTLADGRVVLACLTDAATGTLVPPPRRLARLAGWLAANAPPWFYEQRLLRPRRMRQFYLNTLRRLSAAPALPPSPPATQGVAESLRCDCLVVGGGRAGLAAATAAAAQGNRVVLVDAERLGGTARWRSETVGDLPAEIGAARAAGVDCREGTTCVGLYADPDRALCVGAGGNLVVHYASIVIATGAYDRLPTVPGNDLPGALGLRAFERLAATHALPPGARIGIYGHPAEVTRALTAAAAGGCSVAWMAGPGELPESALRRYPGAALLRVSGRNRVRAVEVAPGGRLACDVVVMALSQPTYELQAQLGFAPRLAADAAVLLSGATAGGRMQVVGAAAAAELGAPSAIPAERRADDAALLCLCEDVRVRDVRAAIAGGYRDVELVKRHTGAGTGPCQGKLCHAALARCLAEGGLDVRLPTMRPFVRPMPLALYAGRNDD